MKGYIEAIRGFSLGYLVGDCAVTHYRSLNAECKESWKTIRLMHHGELGCLLLRLGVLSCSVTLAWFGLGLMTSDIDDLSEWRLDLWLSNTKPFQDT